MRWAPHPAVHPPFLAMGYNPCPAWSMAHFCFLSGPRSIFGWFARGVFIFGALPGFSLYCIRLILLYRSHLFCYHIGFSFSRDSCGVCSRCYLPCVSFPLFPFSSVAGAIFLVFSYGFCCFWLCYTFSFSLPFSFFCSFFLGTLGIGRCCSAVLGMFRAWRVFWRVSPFPPAPSPRPMALLLLIFFSFLLLVFDRILFWRCICRGMNFLSFSCLPSSSSLPVPGHSFSSFPNIRSV